jgi:hypothetical protein
VQTLLPAVALNNIACIGLFELAFIASKTSLDPTVGHSLAGILAAPFQELITSALLGGGTGLALVGATWRVVRPSGHGVDDRDSVYRGDGRLSRRLAAAFLHVPRRGTRQPHAAT